MIDAGRIADRPEQVGIDPDGLAALFERAEREVREGLLPSAQIAVTRNGKLTGRRTFGSAHFRGVPGPATDDTLYAIFSCTKAITSAAAWILIQEGVGGRPREDELQGPTFQRPASSSAPRSSSFTVDWSSP